MHSWITHSVGSKSRRCTAAKQTAGLISVSISCLKPPHSSEFLRRSSTLWRSVLTNLMDPEASCGTIKLEWPSHVGLTGYHAVKRSQPSNAPVPFRVCSINTAVSYTCATLAKSKKIEANCHMQRSRHDLLLNCRTLLALLRFHLRQCIGSQWHTSAINLGRTRP